VSPRACVPINTFPSFRIQINNVFSIYFHHHTFAVVFIVLDLGNLGLAFALLVLLEEEVVATAAAAVVVGTDGVSPSVSVSDLSRASSNALTLFNLSSPHACFKNS
jgi:hypothetical protein